MNWVEIDAKFNLLSLKGKGQSGMRYKIGEVSKILDIPIDTLRFFEKKGIVSPIKDAENNYRYYESWDINFLLEYKRYRGYQFNTQETREILHKDSLKDLENRIVSKVADIDEKIQYYTLMKEKTEQYLDRLKNIPHKLNKMEITNMPEIYYFVHRYSESENDTYQYNSKLDGIFEKWIEVFPFTDTLLTIRKDDFIKRRKDNIYQCGFGLSPKYVDAFHIPINGFVQLTQKQKCVNTIIRAGKKHTFYVRLLDQLSDYINQAGYQLEDDIIGFYLARVHDGLEYDRFIEIWAPISCKNLV